MRRADLALLTTSERRRGLRLAIAQAILWSMGNSLTSGTLLYSFARHLDIGQELLTIIVLVAALIGAFSVFAPLVIYWVGDVRRSAIGLQCVSGLLLLPMPFVLFAAADKQVQDFTLLIYLGAQQAIQSMASAALWTWISRLAPRQVRGPYLGRREAWRLLAVAPLIFGVGWFVYNWLSLPGLTKEEQNWGFNIVITLGGGLQVTSAFVMLAMPGVDSATDRSMRWRWRDALAPLLDHNFARLLLFTCWSVFFMGLTHRVQGSYPFNVLEFSVLSVLIMRAALTFGQALVSPWLGRCFDRFGNRPVIGMCQFIAATSMLLYLVASPTRPWLLFAAIVALVASVGVQLGSINLTLKLAPREKVANYMACYLGITPIAYAASLVVGEFLYEVLWFGKFKIAGQYLDGYDYTFYIGWVTSMMGLLLLFGLHEEGARSWVNLLKSKLGPRGTTGELATALPTRHPLD
jgi:hypothetical protein